MIPFMIRKGFFLLLFSVLILGVYGEPTKEERQAFQEMGRALEDGLFDLTIQRAEAFLKKYPQSDFKVDLHWLKAKGHYYLGQYDLAAQELKTPYKQVVEKNRVEYLLFQAEVDTLREDWSQGEVRYRDFLSEYSKVPEVGKAQLGLGLCLLRQKKEDEGRSLLISLSQNKPGEQVGQRAALYLGLGSMMKGEWKEAQNRLEDLRSGKLKNDLVYEVSYWLGEIYAQQKQWKESIASYQKVTQDPKASPKELVTKAWYGVGKAYQESKELEKAQSAYEKVFTISDLEALKQAGFRGYLNAARLQKKLPESVEKLKDYVSKNQEKSNAAIALFSIALAYAENEEDEKAISTFEALLVAYPKTTTRYKVYLELGKLYQAQSHFEQSLDFYRKVLEEGAGSKSRGEALFEIGEIQTRQKNYPEAISAYEKAIAEEDSFAERGLFNLVMVSSLQRNIEGLLKYEERFNKLFPQSSFRDRIVMEKVNLLQKGGDNEAARKSLEGLLQNQKSSNTTLLQMRYADLLYQNQKYDEAWQLYEKIAAQSQDDPVFPEAAYKALFAGLAVKKVSEQQIIDGLLSLIKKYPKHSKAPHFVFSLGEIYFQKQDYGNSQNYFDQLIRDYPNSDLLDDAQYWSGKSALGRDDAAGAIAILEKIAEISPLKVEARFLQGKIYLQQLKFDKAIQLLDAVIEQDKEKIGKFYVDALLRKGDALMGSAVSDSTKYELAIQVFQQVIQTKTARIQQWNEAAFKKAKSLQKLNRADEAIASYQDLLNGRITEIADETPEYLWRIKGGLEVADMMQARKDWKAALAIYRKLEQIGGPNQQEFRDAINRIKRENFIYEEEG